MNFLNPKAELFVPDALEESAALSRVTHLGIGAHQDDLEFMAFHGIAACFHNPEQWFAGVTCTNGAGSARTGAYAHFSDEQMQQVRKEEQNLAARIGQYAAMIQLGYTSSEVKKPGVTPLQQDLAEIFKATRPRFVYTHNLADKHETHIGVAVAALGAIRSLPREIRPEAVYGCEVWRDLDWMDDMEKVVQDVSAHPNLAAALNGVFDSQIAGGKRYDLGVVGRRRANATFFQSHAVDRADQVSFAMDLTPLVVNEALDPIDYVATQIERFRNDVLSKLRTRIG